MAARGTLLLFIARGYPTAPVVTALFGIPALQRAELKRRLNASLSLIS
jgi:hypothetical protein